MLCHFVVAAQLSCIAIIGLFTCCITVCLTGALDLKAYRVLLVISYLLNIIMSLLLILDFELGLQLTIIFIVD